jgi:hypothetical protein
MPTITTNTPLNVNQAGGSSNVENLESATNEANQLSAQFGQLLNDPNFTGKSEMSTFLKLQQAIAKETMMFQTVSNVMKARTDASKNAIQNMR